MPRRARQLIPAGFPRRGQLIAACAVLILLTHLLLAQLTIVLALAFVAAGKVTRWRLCWLLAPAVAGLAWMLAVGPGGGLLLGVDLKKDPLMLHRAYNDTLGVTAAFNLNLLRRLNREAGADFNLNAFRHEAVWNDVESRIEIHHARDRLIVKPCRNRCSMPFWSSSR